MVFGGIERKGDFDPDLNGPIRKPNAAQSLGGILCVRVTPDEYFGKYTVNEAFTHYTP